MRLGAITTETTTLRVQRGLVCVTLRYSRLSQKRPPILAFFSGAADDIVSLLRDAIQKHPVFRDRSSHFRCGRRTSLSVSMSPAPESRKIFRKRRSKIIREDAVIDSKVVCALSIRSPNIGKQYDATIIQKLSKF